MSLDKQKLLKWLKVKHKEQEDSRDRSLIGHPYYEFHEGASDYLMVVIKAIEEGGFDLKG